MVLTAAGEGVQGWILFTVAAGWCPGTACCSVSGPRGVAATTTGCWPAHQAAAVSGPAGCSACVVCSTATLCTTLSRQAVSTPHSLTSIFRKLGARLLSGCIHQLRFFIGKSLTHSLIAKMISKLQMSQQFLVIMLSLPRHLTVQLGPYLLSVPGPPGRHMVCRARKYVRKKFANPRKNKKFLFRISVNCVGYPSGQMKTIATSAHYTLDQK